MVILRRWRGVEILPAGLTRGEGAKAAFLSKLNTGLLRKAVAARFLDAVWSEK